MKRFLWLFILFLLLHPSKAKPIFAQGGDESTGPSATLRTGLEPTLHFTHLTSDDGLAQNFVETIFQDSRGFMWIGTRDGLSRFDGYRFTTFKHNPDNPDSLSHNWVRDLFEDREGMIWIATEGGGVNKFDPRTETFRHYRHDPQNPNSLGGDNIFSIFQDSAGNFWFGGPPHSGLNKFDPITETFTRYFPELDNPSGVQFGGIWQMLEDEAGNLWLAADFFLVKFNPRTQQFNSYPLPGERRLETVQQDAIGRVWVGGLTGLYKFDPQTERLTNYRGLNSVSELRRDESDLFWISGSDGLVRFNPQTEQIVQHYQHDPTDAHSLSDSFTTALYLDKAGVLWIGTAEDGLNLLDPRQTRFAHYRHNPAQPRSLAEDSVSTIVGDESGILWVGTSNILNQIDLASGQVTHYTPESLGGRIDPIQAVYQDRAGFIWVGTDNSLIFRFDPTLGEFTEYPVVKKPLTGPAGPPQNIIAFYEDDSGALWVDVFRNGLYRLDAQRETIQAYRGSGSLIQALSNDPHNIAHDHVSAMAGDPAGYIWLGYYNGMLSRFDPRTQTFQHYLPEPGNPTALPDGWIEAIHADRHGLIWLASKGGFIRFDPDTETAKLYTEQNGLPTAFVVGILEDSAGNLWLSTQKGLVKFDPRTETFRPYDAADGLQGNEFNARAAWQAADGRMFFGGTNGLTVFYPDQISDNSYHPPVILTEFRLFNEPVQLGENSLLARPIWAMDHLTLNHDQNILSFEFAALSYTAPHKNRYRYKLEGLEDTWNEVNSNRRFASYTNLPAGAYIFRVKATNNDGVWSDKEVALNLTVLPPWWETAWFRGLVLALGVGLVYGGYRWRVQSIEKRNRLLESQVAARTRELTERTEDLTQSYARLEQEIVERQRAQEQLQRAKAWAEERSQAAEAANRAKSAFLANMSHELRSPLNAILGFAQVMVRSQTLPPEQQENLRIISRSGEHLLALINQVLDFSKIEAGRIILNENDFDLHRLLTDLEDMFSLKAHDKGLQLIFDRPADLPRYIRTDEVKLRQVLINLLSNALKFTEKGGVTLRVGSREYGVGGKEEKSSSLLPTSYSLLHFEVEDTGPGIAPDEMDNLFEAFAQTETGRKTGEGAGLGLPISRKFIQLMGGDIEVQSQVGQGTIFTFNIQAQQVIQSKIQNPKSAKGVQNQVVALEPGQPHYRILVVDDQWANRQLLIKLLSPLGFELREAENGQQAWEIWQEFAPQLIWMDMRMPVLDGYQATQRIKATTQGQATAVIALTASAFEEERAVVLSVGCDDFLRKPFREADIFALMSKHIGVRYVYAEDSQLITAPEGQEKLQIEALASERAGLPADLLAQLTEGAELGDIELIDQAVAEIRPLRPALATGLARLAYNFEYDEIIKLIQGGAE